MISLVRPRRLLPTQWSRLQILIGKLTGQGKGRGVVHLLAVLLEERLIDLGSRGSERGGSDELL